ncbi:MAG: dihydrofolate reductase family protein [Candidatus Thermoplasmatota archaeon]|nr:dihydrofolate reductase family protein [Candidatus Thermoplasmatota archaeon]
MRKVILDTIISLDGYYTSPKSEIDWLEFDREEIKWSKQILRRVDAMLYGRITYQEFSEFWPKASPSPDGFDSEIIGQLNGLQKVVFSRTLPEAKWCPAVLIRENPVDAVTKLKKDPGKDMVIVGSGTLVSALVRNELIDEYRIRIRPIILGAGRPLFADDQKRHKLKLISSRASGNGVVALHYEPAHQPSI